MPSGVGVSRYIEDPLLAFGCCLLYGWVVVALTHSPFPFSILFNRFESYFIRNPKLQLERRIINLGNEILQMIKGHKSVWHQYLYLEFCVPFWHLGFKLFYIKRSCYQYLDMRYCSIKNDVLLHNLFQFSFCVKLLFLYVWPCVRAIMEQLRYIHSNMFMMS